MTTAICLLCGHFKFGSWTACEHCGHIPDDTLDRLQHLLVSDHTAKPEALERISDGLQRGENLEFDSRDIRADAKGEAASIALLIQAVESGQPPPPELREMLRTVENFRIPPQKSPISTPRKSHIGFAYQFLPDFVFDNPQGAFDTLTNDPIHQTVLGVTYDQIAECHPSAERVPRDGLYAERLSLNDAFTASVITMPKAGRQSEALFVCVVFPRVWAQDPAVRQSTIPRIRMFALAITVEPGTKAGVILSELFKNTAPKRLTYNIGASKSDFLDAVRTFVTPCHPLI